MKKATSTTLKNIIALVCSSIFLVSCNQTPTEPAEPAEEAAEDTTVVQEDHAMHGDPHFHWVVAEHHLNEIPVTSEGHKSTPSKKEPQVEEKAIKVDEKTTRQNLQEIDEEYSITTHVELNQALANAQYKQMEEVIVTEAIIPLDETQTLVSYSGHGEAKDTLQVIHGPDGEVHQVIFTHKHHKDIYNVENGMTAAEVKELRKEVKHMIRHGKVFLYTEDSNILYVLDAEDMDGNEFTEADIADMRVEAIIWKDKKHHPKED